MSSTDNLMDAMTGMVAGFRAKIAALDQGELDDHWFFKWNDSRTVAQNVYEFTDKLELYRYICREWETGHNGGTCVVERVRDTYLMPRIKEFVEELERRRDDGWVSVDDRLPDDDRDVLVVDSDGNMLTAFWVDYWTTKNLDVDSVGSVTHWREKPGGLNT